MRTSENQEDNEDLKPILADSSILLRVVSYFYLNAIDPKTTGN
jgi:hypothetical protein